MPPTTMTVAEVASLLRISPITVYRELVKRRLPGFKVGNQWRVRRDILEEWMEQESGWTKRFDRLWLSLQRRGRKGKVTESVVSEEVRAVRKGGR